MNRPVIDASGAFYKNWSVDIPAPIIVNPDATVHALTAWCCGELIDLMRLAGAHLGNTDIESEELAGLFFNRLVSITNVMRHLGEATRHYAEEQDGAV